MTIHAKLQASWAETGSLLCVGLDPDPARYPAGMAGRAEVTFEFCRDIVDATKDLVCAFKPQIAFFSAIGAERALEQLIAHIRDVAPGIPLILDAKRGDIGSTAERYAEEAFGRYGADAVTVSPFLGYDTLEPFLARGSVLVLCRTSNPGSADLQGLLVDGQPLAHRVALEVRAKWGDTGRVGLVTGATYPTELATIRGLVGGLPLLVPGFGAQGAGVADVAGAITAEGGVIVNSSRDVLYASGGRDFADAARHVADAARGRLADAWTPLRSAR